MTAITAKTALAAGVTSAWSDTDGYTNIIIGADSGTFSVEFRLGAASDIYYQAVVNDEAEGRPNSVVVAKAYQVRVLNEGNETINYEVFA